MLRVIRGSNKIEVRFDHKLCRPDEIEGLTGICVDDDRRCSLATVNVNGSTVGRGMAVCHPADNFCRATGRKRALSDALCSLNRDARRAVWQEYKVKHGF